MTNILHLHLRSPDTTANDSPSIGAYLLSLSLANREPAKISFQCPSTHPGVGGDGQLQCFWVSVNPIPIFDQSVARQVGRLVSNDFTPSRTSFTISSLEASKISLRVASQ